MKNLSSLIEKIGLPIRVITEFTGVSASTIGRYQKNIIPKGYGCRKNAFSKIERIVMFLENYEEENEGVENLHAKIERAKILAARYKVNPDKLSALSGVDRVTIYRYFAGKYPKKYKKVIDRAIFDVNCLIEVAESERERQEQSRK